MREDPQYLIIDIETNAIDFERGTEIDQAHTIWCVCTYNLSTKEEISYGPDSFSSFCNMVFRGIGTGMVFVGHNILSYDAPILEKILGIKFPREQIVDTLVLSRLLYPDRPGGHSLREWGDRLGFPKGDFNDFSSYSEDMRRYCEQDVKITARVFQTLWKEAKDWGFSVELEHKIADIMARQQRQGMVFNVETALSLERELTEKVNAIDVKIHASYPHLPREVRQYLAIFKADGGYRLDVQRYALEIGMRILDIEGPFTAILYHFYDLNSPLQQKELLGLFGWKPTNFTPTGLPQLDDSIAEVPVIGALLHERNVLNDRLKKVSGLLDMVEPATGRIHGGANPCGTPTGRMRHKRIVNIPKVSVPYGKELRALFTVPPGYVLVGYDAASLELRILAHYIGSEKYTNLVISTDKTNDAHTLARDAAEADSRDTGKTINYALIYGAGDDKLGSIVGKGKAAGKAIREKLFHLIPNFKKLIDRVKKASAKGFLKGLDGRKLWLRSEHKGLNTVIQGGGAVFMKTVAVELDELMKSQIEAGMCAKVLDMHDEAQWEVRPDYVDLFKQMVEQAFKNASEKLQLRCPQAPEIKVGNNWMETH